jgi:hypothetical protein
LLQSAVLWESSTFGEVVASDHACFIHACLQALCQTGEAKSPKSRSLRFSWATTAFRGPCQSRMAMAFSQTSTRCEHGRNGLAWPGWCHRCVAVPILVQQQQVAHAGSSRALLVLRAACRGLSGNQCNGSLPSSWGLPTAFPRLNKLTITNVWDAPASQRLSGGAWLL